jgi:hypothetical protein
MRHVPINLYIAALVEWPTASLTLLGIDFDHEYKEQTSAVYISDILLPSGTYTMYAILRTFNLNKHTPFCFEGLCSIHKEERK